MEGADDVQATGWYDKHYSTAIFIGLISLICIFAMKYILKRPRLPPGPRPLPVLGNAHQLDMKLLHQSLANLSKKYGDIMYLRLGPIPLLIISSPAMVEEVFKIQDHIFASRPRNIVGEIFDAIALAPLGETWRRLRRLISNELVTPKRIQQSQGRRTGEILKFVKHILEDGEKGTVNMSQKLSELVFNLATQQFFSRSFYGYKTSVTEAGTGEGKTFPTLIKESMERAMFVPGDIYPFLRKLDIGGAEGTLWRLQKELNDFLSIIMEEHRKEGVDESNKKDPDFVDVLLSLQSRNDENSLTDKQIKALIYDLVLASTDVISVHAMWFITDVIRHPRVVQNLQKELDSVVGRDRLVEESDLVHMQYLDAAIKECMRLRPGFPLGGPHESTQATKIAGYDIPAKTRAFLNLWGMGRDPRFWDNPLEFNPDRFLNSPIDLKGQNFHLLPFGAGRRKCPGMSLGIIVLQHILAQLFHACDFSPPSGMAPEGLDVQEVFQGFLQRKVPLELCVSARLPSHAYNHSAITSDNVVAV